MSDETDQTPRVRHSLGQNALLGIASQVWLLVLNVAATPVILHYLGPEAFGVWMTVNVVSAYFVILDFGLTRAVVKLLADSWALGKNSEAEAVFRSANALFLAFGLLGASAVAGGGRLLSTTALHLPEGMTSTATLAFSFAALSFLANMGSMAFSAVPMALQRFEYFIGRLSLSATLSTGGAVVLVFAGYGLVPMLALTAVVNLVLALGFGLLVSRRLIPGMRLRPAVSRPILKRLAAFSAFKFLSTLSDQAVFQLDRLMVGAYLPIAAVTYYSVPAVIVQRLLPFVGHVVNAAFPAVSAAAASGRKTEAVSLYLRSSRLALAGLLPLCLFGAVMAEPILAAWAGADVADKSALTLRVLLVAGLLAGLAGAGTMVNEAFGRPQRSAFFALISAALNVSLNLAFIPLWGYQGAAYAFFANMWLQVPVFIVVTNRSVDLPGGQWLRGVIAGPAAAATLASLVFVPALLVLDGLASLVVAGLAFYALYAAAAFVFVINDADRRRIIKIIRGARESGVRRLASAA